MSKFRSLATTAWLGMIATSLLASCASKDTSNSAAKDAGPPPDEQKQAHVSRPEPTHDVVRDLRARFRVREPDPDRPGPSRSSANTLPLLQLSEVEKFDAANGALEARVAERFTTGRRHQTAVSLPTRATAAFRVTDKTSNLWIEAAVIGADDVQAEVADGFVIYRKAMGNALGTPASGHVVHRVHAGGTEDFIAIDTPPSAPELSYRVHLGDGVRGLRVIDNNVEFVDLHNGPRLRMSAPYLIDSKGVHHDASVSVTDCAYDSDPSAPWGRKVTPPGSRMCTIKISWAATNPAYPVLLDPAWTTAADMSSARRYHTLTPILKNGVEYVLCAGGENATTFLATALLLNTSDLTWALTGNMGAAHVSHTATNVSPGTDNARVIVIGGASSATAATNVTRSYNPVTGTWTKVNSMTAARVYHSTLLLGTGKILAAAGSSTYPALTNNTTAEIYDPATNTWTDSGDTLNVPRSRAMLVPVTNTAVLTDLLLVGGTSDDSDTLTDAEGYNAAYGGSGTWTKAPISALPHGMKSGHVFGTSGTSVYVVGSGIYSYKYQAAGTWTSVGPTTYSYSQPAAGLVSVVGPQFLVTASNAEVYRNVGTSGWARVSSTLKSHQRGAGTGISSNRVVVSGGQSTLDGWVATTEVFAFVENGGTCSWNGECSSKYCVDGVCCNTACSSDCYACSAAKKFQGSDGLCGPVLAGKDPDNNCADDGAGTCDRNGFCDGNGGCQLYANMTVCADPVCSAGQITENRCNGSGDCLSAQLSCSPYQCATVTSCRSACTVDTHCVDGFFCGSNNKCIPKLSQGSPCTASGQCTTNFCVDSVCCNEACTGLCKGCTAAIKGSGGGADGECGFVVSGEDTQEECSPESQATCGRDGSCNGAGACKLWSNVSCGSTWCDANTLKGQRCDGNGTCVNDGTTGTPCSPYLCVGSSCTTPCVADSSCVTNYWCDDGVCRAKLANGQPCQASSQCTNGNCVDGYCCNSACSGLCYSCSAAKKHQGINGECGPVLAGYDEDDDCAVGAECKEDGTCNGSGACRMQLSGTTCGSTVCVANAVAEQMCNGLGTCINQSSGSECAPYLCSSGACTSPCAADLHCVNGYFCDSGACMSKFPTGTACTAGSQCTTGNCIDGFCCDTSCGSLCNACSAAKKGTGADGVCGAISAGDDPDEECAVGTECGQDGFCNGSGACGLQTAGKSCGATECVGNKVTGQICNGAGLCINDAVGTECSPYLCSGGACSSPCVSDSNCVTGHACINSVCVPKKANGAACSLANECLNGNCVDSVCCDQACSGLCVACSAALKGGGLDGECDGIKVGTDPNHECDLEAGCGKDGTCDGIGACRLKVAGTSCGASQCLGNKVTGQVCDGLGLCVNDAVGTECAPHLCSGGACSTPCVSDANCVTGYFCSAGTCLVQKAIGATCSAGNECDSDYCVDGVCCDSACSSLCKACSSTKKGGGVNGECGAIKAGADPDEECSVEAGCGKDGTCNGAGLCRLKQAGVSCGASQCVLNKVTGQVCDGSGLCINDAVGTECAPYLCSGGACSNPCVSDANCTGGNFCINGTCQAKKANGQPCTIGNECSTGFCTDSVCCNSQCSGLCSACSTAKKGSGADGECASIQAGADPDNECQVEAACGQDGTCSGQGACRLKLPGVSCGSSQCVGNTVKGQVCDGSGLCINDSIGTDCTPHLCSGGACSNPCVADANCMSGYFCNSGTCTLKKATGQACSGTNQCTTGFCVDGYCCNSACSGMCAACSAAKKGAGVNGECGSIASGQDPDDECTTESGCSKDGTCDGIGGCRLKVAGTSCGASQCLGNKVTGQVCDGLGLCVNDAVGTECAPHLCSGGACITPCVADSNCVSGYFCNAGSCEVQKAIGATCSAGNECDSDYCVDGVCCDSACSSLCKACSAAKKGGGLNGECGAIQAGSDPDDECSVEAGCGKDGTCNGTGLCRLKQAGVSCGSSQCVINKVTGQVCDGSGLCINDAVGTECAPYMCSGGACSNPCVSDANCTSGNFCINGTCQAKKSNGQSCSIGNECSTGFCTDGVCCNQECSGLCSACSAAKKGSGVNGECGSIQAGADPDSECQVEAACGQDGTCNGQGACRLKLPGVSCGSSQCVGNTVKGQVCDGSGLCINDAVGTDCTPHLCSGGACSNPCVADANCTTGYFCSSGTCTLKKATGQACSGANQCTTGFCADGFCCNSLCSGLCAACSAAKKGIGVNGECGSVAAGQDPDDECAVEAGCAKDGTCNGAGACRLKVAGTSCGASQCVLNKVTGQVCDGSGLCINDAVGTNCSPYLCSGGACSNPCVSDSNCTNGYFCQSGTCIAKKSAGQACAIGGECGTGFCADGVCCDTQCSGLCSACSKAKKGSGLDGECGSIGSGSDPDSECELEAACGKDGTCNGSGGCRLKLAGVSCGSSQCVGNTVKGQVCDGSGLCINDAVGTTCSPYQCSGGACKSPCLADTDCVNGYFCQAGSCEPKKVSGEACALGNECDMGFCVDGVCCNTQCTGLCSACSNAKKGIGADGECGPILAGSDPENECELEAACGKDGTCDGVGGCRLKQPGVSCGASQCLQNKVTGQQCNGSGACVNNSTGTDCGAFLCENGTCNNPCIVDAHCVPGNYCNQGSCQPKLLVGAACTAGNECQLGYCADGFCCDFACTSPCEACSSDKKESGINGECGPAKAGTDPHNDCTKEAASTCQRDGECDGTGACRLYSEGTSCGDSYCDGNNLIPKECNGSGVCKSSATSTTCSPYMCSAAQGACATGCQSHTECVPNATTWCTPEGKCAVKAKTGTQCSDAAGCETGFCVDGYCCDTECTGQCQACDMKDKEGACTLVTGDPHGKRPKCLGAGTVCAGTCNGALDNECAYQTGNECSSSCKDDNATLKQCDGKGGCEVSGSKACAPFKCDKDGMACLKTCKLDTECATGSKCELTTGKCVEMGSTCKDDFTAQAPNGTQTDCSPYKCANGACRDSCSTSNDCASGYDCSGGKCVKEMADAGEEAGEPATAVSQNTGCGCHVPGSSGSRPVVFGLALLALAAASRRRKVG